MVLQLFAGSGMMLRFRCLCTPELFVHAVEVIAETAYLPNCTLCTCMFFHVLCMASGQVKALAFWHLILSIVFAV